MSGAFKGRSVTFEWNGSEIPGVREKGLAISGEPVDVTSDEDAGWRTLLDSNGATQDQIDITLSGVTKSSILKRDWFEGSRSGTATLTYPDGTTISGTFYLSAYNETGAYNDATTFDATLMSSGPVVFSPYA